MVYEDRCSQCDHWLVGTLLEFMEHLRECPVRFVPSALTVLRYLRRPCPTSSAR